MLEVKDEKLRRLVSWMRRLDQWGLGPYDAVPPHEAHLRTKDVHRAARPTRSSSGLAVKLGHDGLGGETLRQRLRVRAVRRDDVIVLSERQDAPGGGTLLADVEVTESSDFANRVGFFGLLLESPVKEHLSEELDELFLGEPAERGTSIHNTDCCGLSIGHQMRPSSQPTIAPESNRSGRAIFN